MPFIPHTRADVEAMLATIGVSSPEALFDEIPQSLPRSPRGLIDAGLNEMALTRLMKERAGRDAELVCFAGGGAYEHHIPAAVWELASRGEFYSAYTPYQPEASQGILQVFYEYQSMLSALTGLPVANASMYDGATALVEAIRLALRQRNRERGGRVLLPASLVESYREVVETLLSAQGVTLEYLPWDERGGGLDTGGVSGEVDVLVVAQPNGLGIVEEVDTLVDRGHGLGALVVALINPVAMGLLKPPGEWGRKGADVACGEGQPLGVPLSSGGPYFGFICCQKELVRQLPGRVVGRTVDRNGRGGFVLTLQTREQHIRRAKATSNICTNQGLLAIASAIHMSLLGPRGLKEVALACHANTRRLLDGLTALPGVSRVLSGPFFHEGLIRLPSGRLKPLLEHLRGRGILGGVSQDRRGAGFEDTLLVCATETRTAAEIEQYIQAVGAFLKGS
ncbi:MAG: aminomethyl-transferring glycine dehydrogenase subunit GcvPA [Magnetococcales bacterium]|nr:aminomethyl-transferring glycine dehydrogenase subunit GcvPA [Magnetococcales bacterium]